MFALIVILIIVALALFLAAAVSSGTAAPINRWAITFLASGLAALALVQLLTLLRLA